MKIDLRSMPCPACGATPEWRWRERGRGTCHGSLKCPYEHHAVYQAYNVGSQEAAKKSLLVKWAELLKEHKPHEQNA